MSRSHAARAAVATALAFAAADPQITGPLLRGVFQADPTDLNLKKRGCPFRGHPTHSCASALPQTARAGLGPRLPGFHGLGLEQAHSAARNHRCRLGS
ncbi:hypothetical protein PF005_g6057 [Phytophthora fragariae]|uniref:Uncharacterized protein n=1 Tax=Phytophthora fragariae TaxID=53985 RepID=A0A6A3LM81_9STRA|nr:hypothetical protein PF011_g5321 [Phytophthora fragariae]KAE9126253.1 hypothetical protein PF010_g5335 [Phytophthora fragariae]KAE9146942.1 hypothetical protein PF006_g8330 [Phytophthora fragariae]KAE9224043.1 hypothetical protein PF005_g6057 [Phytophthora fragariae]KAE9251565.1 hypothetical protein PF002_g4226 [Phytophthora fragariae]